MPPSVPEGSADVARPAVDCPKGLSGEAKDVWKELSTHAITAGTLTAATAMAFADLCDYIVLERKLRAAPLTVAGPDHRGMMARVEAGRVRFRLLPDGKAVATLEPVKDEWAEFDSPLQLVKR